MKKRLCILLCALLFTAILGGVLGVNAASDTVNGFRAFATGGLVGGTEYDPNITLNDYSGTDRVLVTGRGGTNYGDPNNPRSTMGVYSVEPLRVDKLEILYSVEQWISSGDHWYAFALSDSVGAWFENDGSDNALFFMFQYVNGNVILKPHHIGNGAGWTYLGDTVGVPAAAGQYSIRIDKSDAGYVVSMKNAEQTDYTPQITVDTQIVEGLFPSGKAYLMAGAYVATYADPWAFVLGAHEAEQPTEPAPQPSETAAQPTEPATTAPSGTEDAQPTDPTASVPPKTGDGAALMPALALLAVSAAAVMAMHRRKLVG